MTKTIGLSDDAYRRLATLKRKGESFTDVVRRLTGPELLRRFVGTMDTETAEGYKRSIREGRARQEATKRERVRRMAD